MHFHMYFLLVYLLSTQKPVSNIRNKSVIISIKRSQDLLQKICNILKDICDLLGNILIIT